MIPKVAGSSPVDRPLLLCALLFMSTFEAILLGILQGLTEFFPVSSSGHLELGQIFLGLTNLEQYVLFDLVCHLGTLLALFIVFFKQIKETFLSDRVRFAQVVLGTLPLFPLVLFIKPLKALFDQPQYLGYCFLFTAFLLYTGIRVGEYAQRVRSKKRWQDPLIIGTFQAIAVFPGVSRSGATISAGRFLGWKQEEAVTFSFLLAIPAILGGVALELLQLLKSDTAFPPLEGMQYIAGFLSSLVVGYLALRWLIRLSANGHLIYFVWYCVVIGIATLFYFNI